MLAWEKIGVWVLALIVLLIIIFFVVSQLKVGGHGVVATFLDMLKGSQADAAKTVG